MIFYLFKNHLRLDVEGLKAVGIMPGPLYSKIKAGENVTLKDGKVVLFFHLN